MTDFLEANSLFLIKQTFEKRKKEDTIT